MARVKSAHDRASVAAQSRSSLKGVGLGNVLSLATSNMPQCLLVLNLGWYIYCCSLPVSFGKRRQAVWASQAKKQPRRALSYVDSDLQNTQQPAEYYHLWPHLFPRHEVRLGKSWLIGVPGLSTSHLERDLQGTTQLSLTTGHKTAGNVVLT